MWKPRTLVIGPGGVKGYLCLGFLHVFEERGLLDKIDTFAGVSVGSIISLLMVVGYTIKEIIDISEKLEMFKDASNFSFQYVIENQGLISNQPIRQVLYKAVNDKLGCVPTLDELYTKCGKALITVTLNTTDQREEIMTPFSHPKVCCIDAVMYSMNIPFVFYKLMCNHKNYVDGALANPYPVDFFDNGIDNVLGIFMSNKEPEEKKIIRKVTERHVSFFEYASKILSSLLLQRRNSVINRCSNKCRHVMLNYKGSDAISIKCTDIEKVEMLVIGYNQARDFLNGELEISSFKEIKYEYPLYEL